MKLKLHILFAFLTLAFCANAQDEIFWSGSSANGEWDWGNDCTAAAGGNWYWNSSGTGNRKRPDCYATFNILKFDNTANTTMNLNSNADFSVNRILFLTGTSDRTINTNVGRRLFFQNNNGNCKIENYVAGTTHTFNVDIFVNSFGNFMEINPVNGYLLFNNTIRNNSDNPINIYGAQQVTFSGDIAAAQGITINNTAVVVYTGTSKTYTGTTTINTGTKLKISSNQTLVNLTLNGGSLEVDSGVTLTLTGNYTATSGTINNKGTIKLACGSVSFPSNASVNNGTTNTMTSLEIASTGIVTINKLLNITNTITVSTGTLLLSGFDLRLNNAVLNIAAAATFDNGGENQIINVGGSSAINISGTFITRDQDGFVGTNTAIPSITPNLITACTIEYGLNGNQAVQGGRSYYNMIFSNGGTKTLSSAIVNPNFITGTVTIKDSVILDVENKSFGDSGTKLTMTGTSEFRTAGTGVKPDFGDTYTLGIGTKITFTNTASTLQSIRLFRMYYNIDIVGSSVGTNTQVGSIDFQSGGTLTIKSSGTFKLSNTLGFTGGIQTAISNINNPTINLESGSTIEYAGANQTITSFTPAYSNLSISGTGIKTAAATNLIVGNDLNIKSAAAQLTINSGQTFIVTNKVNNTAGTFVIENNGSLVQINDAAVNSGNLTYIRNSTSSRNTDYIYWSTPVSSAQSLSTLFPKTQSSKFYSYEVTAASEDWKQESSSATMSVGKGYSVRGPEPSPPNPPSTPTTSFIGTPNNGLNKITGIFPSKSYLIGNPYPSALNADKFLTDNAGVLEGTLYFWTHNTEIQDSNNITTINPNTGLTTAGSGAYAYTSDDYASYNLTGGVGIGNRVNGVEQTSNKPTGKIAAAQGFFASSNDVITGNNEIVFNNSMRLRNTNTTMENSQFFKTKNLQIKNTSIEKNRIWLNIKNSQGAFKQTLIGYITNATNEYDSRFDGLSFDSNKFIDFYSINKEKKLVIQGRALPFNENDEVPLGFRSTINGNFTIEIDQVDGVFSSQGIYIEDKVAQTIFDLKKGSYTFNTVAGIFNDRFVIKYTNKTTNNNDFEPSENRLFVSNKNNQIKINSNHEKIDKVSIYNLSGKQLFQKENINSTEFILPNLSVRGQVVLVKASLENGALVSTKILH